MSKPHPIEGHTVDCDDWAGDELRRRALDECDEVCTSGCHADDCEHHGHLPLAARPDPVASEGLDVERLERAIAHSDVARTTWQDAKEHINGIAREYATPPQDPPEGWGHTELKERLAPPQDPSVSRKVGG